MNVITRLEYELAYYDSAVHRFNHYTTRTPPPAYEYSYFKGTWSQKTWVKKKERNGKTTKRMVSEKETILLMNQNSRCGPMLVTEPNVVWLLVAVLVAIVFLATTLASKFLLCQILPCPRCVWKINGVGLSQFRLVRRFKQSLDLM